MSPADRHQARSRTAPACVLGTIVNTHGIHGELRMLPFNPDSETLRPGMTITLRWPDRSVGVLIRSLRPHKRLRLLKLDGYDSADTAAALVGAEVCIDADQLPQTRPGEFYHRDLIGLRVETVAGQELGIVEQVLTTQDPRDPSRPTSQDVCVVRGFDREHLIPLITDIVRNVDLAAGKIVIDPIPGLLDG